MSGNGNVASVGRWRRAERQRLRRAREALPRAWVEQASASIASQLEAALPALASTCFAFTWPLAGEPDLSSAAARWIAAGGRASLPETRPKEPLTFRPWQPGCRMRPGVWEIPFPDTKESINPAILITPCLGYDADGYRLGHGGGFYDRTLAAMNPRPLAVGVGWSSAALPTIHPQAHDIPMDLIVTERAVIWHRRQA
jgi:5-formyltetrahydrofolate cyclo-ligase